MTTPSNDGTTWPPPGTRDAVDLLLRAGLVASGVVYVAGFVVVNLHLARFGYYWLGLFDRQYPLAGLWVLLPPLLWAIIDRYSDEATEWLARWRTLKEKTRAAVAAGLLLFASGLTIFVIGNAIQMFGVRVTSLLWMAVTFMWGITVWWPLKSAYTKGRQEQRQQALSGAPTPASALGRWMPVIRRYDLINVPMVLIYLALFSQLLFREIPQHWGGGGGAWVQLITSAALRPPLQAAGVAFRDSQTTEPVLLVASSERDLVLLVDSTRTVVIDRLHVLGIVAQGRFKVPRAVTASPRDTTPAPGGVPDTAVADTAPAARDSAQQSGGGPR